MNTRSKVMMWNTTAIILLLTGVALIAYPKWSEYNAEQQQLKLLTQWQHFKTDSQTSPLATNDGTTKPSSTATTKTTPTTEARQVPTVLMDGLAVYGVIAIDKIDMRGPMVAEATEQSLAQGIGVVLPDRVPGGKGNFVLAGHRSWTYGKHFSRLDELTDGDKVTLETSEGTFVYKVNDSFLVEPDDLSVLESSKDNDARELTLITCEPMKNPTHRLIVKAQLESKPTSL
ncbi:class D sortase [Paenibacillus sp. 481]|uniref:class D sortase n=1 Tax=Paenibacillus sp. 481 TaxID=2835869 RepID=UPI001E51B1DD|nr:class D sortase [Paenibacillus sp. 481]UHA71804.1 class D sortase [Paenibacillus sp. 481]